MTQEFAQNPVANNFEKHLITKNKFTAQDRTSKDIDSYKASAEKV